MASAVGLAYRGPTYSLAAADQDGDGITDHVLMGRHATSAQVYSLTERGTLRPGSTLPRGGWRPDRHGCAWADFDRDGRDDVACANGRGRRNRIKATDVDNELWLGRADGSFVDVGTAWGIGDPCGRGRAQYALDADGDGRTDLYTANETPRDDDPECQGRGTNRLYLAAANPGGGRRMVPAPERGLDLPLGHGRCGAAFDWNADGRQDLLLCTGSGVRLFANRGGTGFREATSEAGLAGARAVDAELVDLDGDGDRDLVGATWRSVTLRLAEAGRFGAAAELQHVAGGGVQSIAAGDYDGDGRPDLYVLRSTDRPGQVDADDLILLQGPPLDFSTVVAVPPTVGRGSDVERLRLPGVPCDLAVVLNGRGEVLGPTQVVRLTAPACG